MKKERTPTDQEFNKLLSWFHPNRDAAAVGYNSIQTRLIQIFASRGCVDADELAYEVSNRVATRIDTVISKYPDAAHCCLAFVSNVYHEYLREQRKRSNLKQPPPSRPADELEREDRCLQECLRALKPDEHNLFISYFGGEKRPRIEARRKLAEELKLTANALRIQAHRLRKRMRLCIEGCLAQA